MSDIYRYRGETRAIQRTIQNEAGVVLNISGWTVTLTVNREENPTDTVEQIMQLSGVITDAVNGVVEFYPDPADMDFVGTFYYDIWAVDAVTRTSVMIKGRFIFFEKIIKPGVSVLPDVTWIPTGTHGEAVPSGGSSPWIMSWEEGEPSPWKYELHDSVLTITPSTIGTGSQHTALKPNGAGGVPSVLAPSQGLRILCWLEPDQQFRFRLLGISGTLFESGGWYATIRFNASDAIAYEIEAEYSVEDKRIEDSWSDSLAAQTAGWFYVLLACGVEDANELGEYYHAMKFWPAAGAEPAWDSGSNDVYISGDAIVNPWVWWLHHQGLPFTDHKWRIAEVKVIRSGITFGL